MDMESAMSNIYAGSQKLIEFEKKSGHACWVDFRVGHLGDAVSLALLFFSNKNRNRNNNPPSSFPDNDINDKDNVKERLESNGNNVGGDEANREILSESKAEEDCSELELKLTDGFGDEQNPPAFHAILAEVCSNSQEKESQGEGKIKMGTEIKITSSEDCSKELCGAAIVTIDWDAQRNLRYLRVEEIKVDTSKVPCPNLVLRRLILSLSALALKTGCDGLVMKEAMITDTPKSE